MLRPSSFFALLVSLSLAACGSDGPTDPGAGGGETGRTVKADPSFASDIYEIFTRRGCTAAQCHGGGQGGLTMTSVSGAYNQLVDVTSPNSGEVRVIAGNAADSYLIKKLEGTATVGQRMPLGGSPLDDIDLQNIRNWINQGAKNN